MHCKSQYQHASMLAKPAVAMHIPSQALRLRGNFPTALASALKKGFRGNATHSLRQNILSDVVAIVVPDSFRLESMTIY
jgi:hypothetical protein